MALNNFESRWDIVETSSASATQEMNFLADAVLAVKQLVGGATSTAAVSLTPVTGTPSSTEIQFTGSPATPSNTLTMSAAPAAAGLLFVQYIPAGTIPAV